jgi:hypothetical protein
MNTNNPLMIGLATQLGFTEDETLSNLHGQIVAAVNAGEPTKELWKLYFRASESQVDDPEGDLLENNARAGLMIARAQICLDADETVSAIYCLHSAIDALVKGTSNADTMLTVELTKLGSKAERSQAWGLHEETAFHPTTAAEYYEDALEAYLESESDATLTDAHRGLLNHRMAECYLGLIRTGAPNIAELQELIVGSLESASAYQVGTPEFGRTQGLIDLLCQQDWWNDAVDRQQS